jgi:hypothetical protein
MTWWKFWKWHACECRTMHDDTGSWGECVICHKRYGFVSRERLNKIADEDLEALMQAMRRRESKS